MKKFSACTILSVSAFCSLLSLNSLKVYADTTMTVKLVSTGNQISGSSSQVYVFPYYFSFNGSTDLTPLMCISYKNEITVGETWTATMVPVSGNEQYVEAAMADVLKTRDASGLAPRARPFRYTDAVFRNELAVHRPRVFVRGDDAGHVEEVSVPDVVHRELLHKALDRRSVASVFSHGRPQLPPPHRGCKVRIVLRHNPQKP